MVMLPLMKENQIANSLRVKRNFKSERAFDVVILRTGFQDLEYALTKTPEEPSHILIGIIVTLLRGISRVEIDETNWWTRVGNILPEYANLKWNKLKFCDKLNILEILCDRRFLKKDILSVYENCNDANSIRIHPFAKDKLGNNLWYLDKTRLYSESKTNGIWRLLCKDLQQWNEYLESLRQTEDGFNMELERKLSSLIPDVTESLKTREKERLLRLNRLLPKRTSARLEMQKSLLRRRGRPRRYSYQLALTKKALSKEEQLMLAKKREGALRRAERAKRRALVKESQFSLMDSDSIDVRTNAASYGRRLFSPANFVYARPLMPINISKVPFSWINPTGAIFCAEMPKNIISTCNTQVTNGINAAPVPVQINVLAMKNPPVGGNDQDVLLSHEHENSGVIFGNVLQKKNSRRPSLTGFGPKNTFVDLSSRSFSYRDYRIIQQVMETLFLCRDFEFFWSDVTFTDNETGSVKKLPSLNDFLNKICLKRYKSYVDVITDMLNFTRTYMEIFGNDSLVGISAKKLRSKFMSLIEQQIPKNSAHSLYGDGGVDNENDEETCDENVQSSRILNRPSYQFVEQECFTCTNESEQQQQQPCANDDDSNNTSNLVSFEGTVDMSNAAHRRTANQNN